MTRSSSAIRLWSRCAREVALDVSLAWAVYGIVECWFTSLLPWIVRPEGSHAWVHPGFTAFLLVFYPAAGLLLGLLAAPWLCRLGALRGALPVVVGPLTILLVLVVNLLHLLFFSSTFFPSRFHLVAPVAWSVLLLLGLGASAASGRIRERLRFATNPWTVSLILVGLPWTTLDLLGRVGRDAKALAIVVYGLLVLGLAFLLHRSWPRIASAVPSRPRGAVTVAVVGVLTFGATLLWRTPEPRPVGREAAATAASSVPLVLLVTMDTVRADRLSLYGYGRDTTPELERLARQATVYRRAIATGDMTLTTHGSLFTGLYGRQHGSHVSETLPSGRPLHQSFVTMAEILAERGWDTAGVVANNGYLTPYFGFDQGFGFWDNRGALVLLRPPPPYLLRRRVRDLLTPLAPRAAFDLVTRRASEINRVALERIEASRARGVPLFLFVNYMDAHAPYIPPPPFDTRYPGKDPSFTSEDYQRAVREVMGRQRSLTEREERHLSSQYDGAIAYVDAAIGELLAHLRENDLFDRALVIVTSDHGESFGDHQHLNHGVSVYEEQVAVPLVIKYPSQAEPQVEDRPTSLVDVFPTVLDVLGLEIPESAVGRSLLGPRAGSPQPVVSESFASEWRRRLYPDLDRERRAIYVGPHKLIRESDGRVALYDLSQDPRETRNLLEERPAVGRELERMLDEWLTRTEAAGASEDLEPEGEALERLKALGYVG